MSRKTRLANREEITDKVVCEFLNAQSGNTRKTYASRFKKVMEFGHESGQEMLDNVAQWSRKILAFQQHLISEGYSLSTTESILGMLRGFFTYYRKTLDLSRSDKRKLGRMARNSEDYSFSQEDIKKMATIADLGEKYVVLAGISYGLRADDFSKLTYGKYRIALENAKKENLTAPIPLGTVNTLKEEVTAYPLISSDALPIIEALLDAHKDAKDDTPVFWSRSTQLTSILQNLVFKAGIETHGQTVRFHCLRKYLFDRLVSVSSTTKASQIIGHKIKGEIAPYIGTGSLREVYERAQPSICITNGNGTVIKARVTELEEENKKLKEKIEQLESEMSQGQQGFSRMINDLKARLDALEKGKKKGEGETFVLS